MTFPFDFHRNLFPEEITQEGDEILMIATLTWAPVGKGGWLAGTTKAPIRRKVQVTNIGVDVDGKEIWMVKA